MPMERKRYPKEWKLISKSRWGSTISIAMAAKARELTEELSRSNRRPTDIKVKRIAALVTDGDRPATNANVQSDTTTRLSFKRERRTS